MHWAKLKKTFLSAPNIGLVFYLKTQRIRSSLTSAKEDKIPFGFDSEMIVFSTIL